MTDQIGVIGAGAWGTTLAVLLADAQRPVSLWTHSAEAAEKLAHERTNERYLPGVVFPPTSASRPMTPTSPSRIGSSCWPPRPRTCAAPCGAWRDTPIPMPRC